MAGSIDKHPAATNNPAFNGSADVDDLKRSPRITITIRLTAGVAMKQDARMIDLGRPERMRIMGPVLQ